MVQIAIVEDEQDNINQLIEYIRQYEQESQNRINITTFMDGDEIVSDYKADYDIILMDIQMQFMDGMKAAERIREMDQEVIIIFITNMTQYAIQGYAVNALDYVLKPVSYFSFSQKLDKAIERLGRKDTGFLTVKTKGGIKKLMHEDICYFESQRHNLIIHTIKETIVTSVTMKEMESKLQKYSFCKCNKGYLINLQHVEGIDDNCAIVNGDSLLISRPRKKEFLEALTNYLGEK